mgnify:CR=1 FL=1
MVMATDIDFRYHEVLVNAYTPAFCSHCYQC